MKYFSEYVNQIKEALDTVDQSIIEDVCEWLHEDMITGRPILTFGNGGSAAIAAHMTCDFMKGVAEDCHQLRPWVINLNSNIPLTTAIANDHWYARIFSEQIQYCPDIGTVIAISSSGNSLNILQGLKTAYQKAFTTIALVGFDGGIVVDEKSADYIIHVKSDNYGVVEDCHSIIMHTIAQTLRLQYADPTKPLKL
jgi:D-sedoheptulose 7-phosphate isomerase